MSRERVVPGVHAYQYQRTFPEARQVSTIRLSNPDTPQDQHHQVALVPLSMHAALGRIVGPRSIHGCQTDNLVGEIDKMTLGMALPRVYFVVEMRFGAVPFS